MDAKAKNAHRRQVFGARVQKAAANLGIGLTELAERAKFEPDRLKLILMGTLTSLSLNDMDILSTILDMPLSSLVPLGVDLATSSFGASPIPDGLLASSVLGGDLAAGLEVFEKR